MLAASLTVQIYRCENRYQLLGPYLGAHHEKEWAASLHDALVAI
jgi:hypothetical protein